MTLQELVNKFNFKTKYIKDYNSYFSVYDDGATKEDLKDYFKMCHDDFNMPYEFMDKILSGNTKIFYHYDDDGELVYDEYGFLQIDALGRVFVLSRLFDFCIYLHQYKITWFLKKNMDC